MTSRLALLSPAKITLGCRFKTREPEPSAVQRLCLALKSNAQFPPIVVAQLNDGSSQLLDGFARWEAAKLTGRPTLATVISEITVTKAEEVTRALHKHDCGYQLKPPTPGNAWRL